MKMEKAEFTIDRKEKVFNTLNHLGIPYDVGELLQAYDEEGNAIEGGVLRSLAHNEGILHGASHTYLYKWEGDSLFILLQRRSMNKDSFPGCLDMSSAGHVEFGSDFLLTAKKELYEELGIEIEADGLAELFVQSIHYKDSFHGKVFEDKEINHIYALQHNCDPSALSLQTSEVSEAIWMSAADITQKLDRDDPELCLNKEETKKVIDILAKMRNQTISVSY